MPRCTFANCRQTEGVTTADTAKGPQDFCPGHRVVAVELLRRFTAAGPLDSDQADDLIVETFDRLAFEENVLDVGVNSDGVLVYTNKEQDSTS